MCKVRIVNSQNNYTTLNNTQIETDIPSEMFLIFKQVFAQLNNTRTNACMPNISIIKL